MDDLKPDALPGILSDIARYTSMDIAIKVARKWGGHRLHVPRKDFKNLPTHPLTREVGIKAARIICHHFGGDRYKVPNARTILRWHDARALRLRGFSTREIADKLVIGEPRVRALLKGLPVPASVNKAERIDPSCPICGHKKHAGAHRNPKPDPRQLAFNV
jgi:hypothetical protein